MHEKFSVLKNVGAPTGMLVTIVSEKIIGRGGNSDLNQQDGGSSNTTYVSNLARSNTLTTNQRLRGLISAKRPSFMMGAEKALPSTTPPLPPPASDKPRSPVLPQHLHTNSVYGSTPLDEQFGSVSQISLPDTGPRNGEGSTEGTRNPN
jgi:vacuolar protein sorting-associated protein 54